MSNLISRVRILINDPFGTNQAFDDNTIQDVLDASRQDMRYLALEARPTFTSGSLQYLDYYAPYGDWEDDLTLWQYLTVQITPATSENIVGHWTFAQNMLPPCFITGKTYDVYRAAADLLERLSARWALSYDVVVDGQNFRRSQALQALHALARQYRMQQRAHSITAVTTDLNADNAQNSLGLGPRDIDYYGSGDGR